MKRATDIIAWILLGLLIAQRFGVPLPFTDPPPIEVDAPTAVLIYEKTGDQSDLLTQMPGLLSEKFKGRSRCVDDDLTVDALRGETQWVRDALALPRQSEPWLVLANGRQGYSGPLPQTIDECESKIAEVLP